MAPYVPVTEANGLAGLSLMLAQYAVSTYECHLLATNGHVLNLTPGHTLAIASQGERLELTGPEPFGMEDTMEHVAARIYDMLERGGTIEVGEASLWIGRLRQLERARRPTEDVLVVETGGSLPASIMIIADRSRGPAH